MNQRRTNVWSVEQDKFILLEQLVHGSFGTHLQSELFDEPDKDVECARQG